MAIGNFLFDEKRCSVATCLEMMYQTKYFFSKFPSRVAPMWNLSKLLSPIQWSFTFASIFLVLSFFVFSAKVYSFIGFKKDIKNIEVILMPVRLGTKTKYEDKNTVLLFYKGSNFVQEQVLRELRLWILFFTCIFVLVCLGRFPSSYHSL